MVNGWFGARFLWIPGIPENESHRLLFRVPRVSKGRGCAWGTLRIPLGKIGVHLREDRGSPPGTTLLNGMIWGYPYFWKHPYGKPCKSKDYFLNGFSVKTIVLVGIYNQQFQGTIILMVFDFQGKCRMGIFQPRPDIRLIRVYPSRKPHGS